MAIPLQKRGDMFLAECSLEGLEGVKLLGIVDSGASTSYVASKVCDRARLKYKGSRSDILCVHGKEHREIDIEYYRGTVTVGTKSGCGMVYKIDIRPRIAGVSVDAILGNDVLRHFNIALNHRDGTGFLV